MCPKYGEGSDEGPADDPVAPSAGSLLTVGAASRESLGGASVLSGAGLTRAPSYLMWSAAAGRFSYTTPAGPAVAACFCASSGGGDPGV